MSDEKKIKILICDDHPIMRFGIAAIIQPGGSRADADVIAACDRLGLPMIFTGRRHFKH